MSTAEANLRPFGLKDKLSAWIRLLLPCLSTVLGL